MGYCLLVATGSQQEISAADYDVVAVGKEGSEADYGMYVFLRSNLIDAVLQWLSPYRLNLYSHHKFLFYYNNTPFSPRCILCFEGKQRNMIWLMRDTKEGKLVLVLQQSKQQPLFNARQARRLQTVSLPNKPHNTMCNRLFRFFLITALQKSFTASFTWVSSTKHEARRPRPKVT